MSTRTFDIFPDVSDWKKEITDDMLEKHYGLTGIEKESIKMQVDNGEGNITNNQREVILNWPQVIRGDDNELKKGNKAVSRKKVIYKVNKLKKTKKRVQA